MAPGEGGDCTKESGDCACREEWGGEKGCEGVEVEITPGECSAWMGGWMTMFI